MDGKPLWEIMKSLRLKRKCVFLAKLDINLYASSVTKAKGKTLEYKLNIGYILTLGRWELKPSLGTGTLWPGDPVGEAMSYEVESAAHLRQAEGGAHGDVWGAREGNQSHLNPGDALLPIGPDFIYTWEGGGGPTPYQFLGGVPLKLHQQCPCVGDRAAVAWPLELVHHHQFQMIELHALKKNYTLKNFYYKASLKNAQPLPQTVI